MGNVSIESRGDVAILRLGNGVTNAISPTTVDDMHEAVDEIVNSCRGLVLAGGSKFFSIGLDLPQLIQLDSAAMSAFFYRFNDLAFKLYTLPMPTVSAIAGHAIAGGTILALTTDYRYSVAEQKQMGLNEIKLGLPVPYLADLMLRQVVDDRTATWMLYGGEFMPLTDGHRIGLIDVTTASDELENKAVDKVAALSECHPTAFAAIKANRVEEVRLRYEQNGKARNDVFLSNWFRPEVQLLLKEAASKF